MVVGTLVVVVVVVVVVLVVVVVVVSHTGTSLPQIGYSGLPGSLPTSSRPC